jgi:uncharacterized Zn-finger protein
MPATEKIVFSQGIDRFDLVAGKSDHYGAGPKASMARPVYAGPSCSYCWRKAADQDHACIMSEEIVPHFHNTSGVAVIEIGAREFLCIGELPPFDHPHVFLDMGDANEIICPYCSTLYRHDPRLDPHSARPAECALPDSATA